MSLLGGLKGAATKLGLLRVVTLADAAEPAKITTRPISLKELASEVHAAEVQALADAPAELNVDVEQVFLAAGIKTPESGWSVEKLGKLAASEPYKSMPREKAQQAILGVLASQKVSTEELVKDAMARDKALDAYGAMITEKRRGQAEVQSRRKAEIENQIAELKVQLERLAEEVALEERQWGQWRERKRAAEKAMAEAISFLLKDPIISVDAEEAGEHN